MCNVTMKTGGNVCFLCRASMHPSSVRDVVYLSCFLLYSCLMFCSFTALTLLIEHQEGHLACKTFATTVHKSFLLRTSLTWSNLTWSNAGKVGLLNEKDECICVMFCV